MSFINTRTQWIVLDETQFQQLLGGSVIMPAFNTRQQQVVLDSIQFTQLQAVLASTAAAVIAAAAPKLLSVETGIIASPIQSQAGATQLNDYSTVHEISVCATVGDAVRLPPAVAGKMVIICNKGVEQAQVWPAIGDQLDPNSPNVASNFVQFIAVDDTQWYSSK